MAFPTDAGRGPISIAAEHETRANSPGGSWRADDPGAQPDLKRCRAPAIFLHSSWRASHTWFWLKFRQHASTVCFYEPFHEILATLTRSGAPSLGPNSWNSRHPATEPYLLEFIPLIRKTGGVRLFVPDIPYRWFLPVGGPAGSLHPQEIKYLTLLIRYADRLRRIPVFGFTRSLGRLPAIKKQFPGIHIFQYRNLWTQWMSWIDHKQNNNEYFFRQLLTIMLEASDPYFSTIMNRWTHHLPRSAADINDHDYEPIVTTLLESITVQDLFTLYMAFHTYLYIYVQNNADIMIDVTKAARDEKYRNQASYQLTCATGIPITFHDVSVIQRYHPFDPALIDWNEIRENVNFAVQMLDHLFDRQELLRHGTELVDETLAEIVISEKYVAAARDEMTTLRSARDAAAAARSTLAAERDRLAYERDGLLAERERLAYERDGLLAERDLLSRQYGAVTAEIDRLAGELAAGKADREKLISENAQLGREVARMIATDAQMASEVLRSI